MTSIVADTHVLIWYVFDSVRLSPAAAIALEEAAQAGDPILISAISLVEIGYLIERDRIKQEVLTRILKALDKPDVALVLVPVDRQISVAIRQIERMTVPDMPDRIIAATALSLNLPLVTRDLRIQALTTIQTIW